MPCRSQHVVSVFLFTSVLVLTAAQIPSPSPSPRANPKRMLIPAYIFPTLPGWSTLLTAIQNGQLPVGASWIVLNANNGVVAGLSAWEKGVWKQQAVDVNAVARAVVYVNMCNMPIPFSACGSTALQGARDAKVVIQWVRDWMAMLGSSNVHGVFLDDTSMAGYNKANILAAITGIRGLKPGIKVFTNPGVAATDATLLNAVDATVYNENTSPVATPPPTALRPTFSDPNKFSMILHDVPAGTWQSYAETASTQGYGYFYATSGGYSDVPSYISNLVTFIRG
jgi:hypothetical protein